MAGTVRELRAVFTATMSGMRSAIRGVQKDLQGIGKTTEKTVQQSNESLGEMRDTVSEVREEMDNLNDKKATKDLNAALKDTRKEFEDTRKRVKDLKENFDAMGKTDSFKEIDKSLSLVQKGLNRTGRVSQKNLDQMEKELRNVHRVLNDVGDVEAFDDIKKSLMESEKQFKQFKKAAEDAEFDRMFRHLPDHLKEFGKEMNTTRKSIRDVAQQGTRSLEDMADAAIKSGVALEKITSVTKTGKSAIKTIQTLGDATKETQLAILGLNKDGTVKISTEETTKRLQKFKGELEQSKRELEKLRDAGDFASYEAGMDIVQKKLDDVNRAMHAASVGGEEYMNMIGELGIHTSDAANQAAIALEATRDKFFQSVDQMNAKSTQSKKMMDILPEVSHIQTVDKFFLGIGNRLENMAKQGTAANIAIKMLGPNASMKDLQDRIALINQGLMRMNMVALGMGIAFAGFTAGLVNAAKGPEMADVFEQRGQLMIDYQKAVQERTQEIIDTWGLFEKAEVEKTKPETLMKNLQGQVDVMKNWQKNIDSLAKRGLSEGLLESLRKMGPEAAGQIQALTQMSDSELNKYVALWKEKHALARKEALTELEGLRQETSQKIKELENSLTPLGIALEKAKSTWAQALQPFVELWGKVAAKVVDGTTAIGNFVNKINELNPSITASAGMFMYLFTALSLILSPMAIGIGMANGMSAAFASIFMMVKPFVLGLLRIAGMASVLSAAIIVVVGSFMKMWKASSDLRNAVTNAWNGIKDAISQALGYLIPSLKWLGKEITTALNNMVGGKGDSIKSFWQTLGDIMAKVINTVVNFLLPQFSNALQHIVGFIIGIAPQIATMVKSIVGFIKTLVSVITDGNSTIGKIFGVVWKVVVFLVQSAWNNIKNIVTSGIAIITNLFQFFTNVLQGNWKAAFNNLWQIVKNVVILVWNYINLMMLGKILGIFKAFFAGGLSLFKAGWSSISTNLQYWMLLIREFIGKIYTAILTRTRNNFNAMLNVVRTIFGTIWNVTKTIFTTIYNFFVGIFSRFISTFRSNWNNALNITKSVFTAIYNFFKKIFVSIYNFVARYVSNMLTNMRNNWTTIKNVTTSIFNAIFNFFKSIFSKIYNTVASAVKSIWNGMKNGWNTARNETVKIFNNIKDKVKGIFDDIVSAAKGLPKRIGDGIKSMADKVKNGVSAIGKKLAGGLETVVNAITQKGINVVLDKIGVDKKNQIPKLNIPGYKKGTGGHPEDGPAFVGDGGEEELVRLPNGNMFLSPNKTTLIPNMPKGTEVFNGKQTKSILDAAIPKYETGNTTQSSAKSMEKSAKESAKKTKDSVSDVIGDVWSYVSDPGKLMKKVFGSLDLKMPDVGGIMGQIAKVGVSKIKDGAVGFIQSKMNEFMPDFGEGGSYTGIGGYYLNSPFRITTRFTPNGNKNDKVHKGGVHKGLDLAAPQGTAIKSLTDGIVKQVLIGSSTAGNGVRIKSGSDVLSYIHMMAAPLVKLGQKVKEGQLIGRVGSTGFSTGPHLDLKIQRNGSYINPLTYLQGKAGGGGGATGGNYVGKYASIIRSAAARFGVSPALVAGIIKQESKFNPNARSPVGATGLMQLMPATSRSMGVKNPRDPQQNIMGGTKYISQMLRMFHNDTRLGLAAYNAGPGNVKKYGGIPPFRETQNYVRIVMANARAYGAQFKGYYKGARVAGKQLAWIAEKGAEYVIPTDGGQRAYDLWQQAGLENNFIGGATTNNSGGVNITMPVTINGGATPQDAKMFVDTALPMIRKALTKDIKIDAYKRGMKG